MKTKRSLTSRQIQLLKNNEFFTVFNEVFNSTLTTSVGNVGIKTNEKKFKKAKHKKEK
jgi:hypothetical protein